LWDIKDIQQIKGNEINSNNFKTETKSGCVLIKRVIAQNNISELRRCIELSRWLYSNNIPVPKIVPSLDGNLIVTQNGCPWIVFEFVEGNFFSGGTIKGLESAGYMIGKLHRVLKKAPKGIRPKIRINYLEGDEDKILNELSRLKNQWSTIFGERYVSLLKRNWDQILSVNNLIHKKKEMMAGIRNQVSHNDLHPHNILVDGNEVSAFLDFDSFKVTNVYISLAYSIYKLIKQHFVNIGSLNQSREFPNHTDYLFRAIDKVFPFTHDESDNFQIFAITEIFRRLMIIFRLNITKKNRSWNHIIPLHLAGLKETEIVFRSNSIQNRVFLDGRVSEY